jgi:hypothetical protein
MHMVNRPQTSLCAIIPSLFKAGRPFFQPPKRLLQAAALCQIKGIGPDCQPDDKRPKGGLSGRDVKAPDFRRFYVAEAPFRDSELVRSPYIIRPFGRRKQQNQNSQTAGSYGFRDLDFFKLRIMAIHEAKYALTG